MFALATPTPGTVRTVNLRTEKHGDDDVTAFDIGVRITGPSSLLDLLHANLREQLYLPPVTDQATIPGESPPWTVLRCDAVPGVAVKHELIGRNVTLAPSTEIESELSGDDELELVDCAVNKFHVTAYQGGSVNIDFRIQCSDIDAAAIGMAGAMLQQEIKVAITHTEVPPNQAQPTSSPEPIEKDATTLFAETERTAAEDRSSPAWPFPPDAPAESAPQRVTTEVVKEKKGAKPPAAKGKAKASVKYRDAATGETWSGRGLQPNWLKAALARGRKLSEFDTSAAAA